VRFADERGWWQNVVFELAATDSQEQFAAVERFWGAHRADSERPTD
jgi:hypothetical protein